MPTAETKLMPVETDDLIPVESDDLIPDPKICKSYNITPMTLWRWRRNPKINYPMPLKIGDRNFVPRSRDQAFRKRMMRQGIGAESSAA